MPDPMTTSEWAAKADTPAPAPVTEAAPVGDTKAPAVVTETAVPVATGEVKTEAEKVQEFLEAQLEGKPYQLPKNVQIPWKRGTEQGFASIEEIQKAHMFEKDYTQKRMADAQERKTWEAERSRRDREAEVDRAQFEASRKIMEEDAKRLAAAFENPEEGERYLQHLKLLQTDPHYRKLHEEATEGRLLKATSEKEAVLAQHDQAMAIRNEILDFVSEAAAKYPGVDAQRVVDRYSQGLQAGTQPLTRSAVDRLFQDEARYLAQGRAPLEAEFKSLQAKVDALTAAAEAAKHNATVDTALARSGRPATTTTGAAPAPASRKPSTPFRSDSDEANERRKNWERAS